MREATGGRVSAAQDSEWDYLERAMTHRSMRCLAWAVTGILLSAPLAAQTADTVIVQFVPGGAPMHDLMTRVSRQITSGFGAREVDSIVRHKDKFDNPTEGRWALPIRFRGRASVLMIGITAPYTEGGVVAFISPDPGVSAAIRDAMNAGPLPALEAVGRVHIALAEVYPGPDRPRAGFVLDVETTELFGSLSFTIVSSLWQRGDTLHLALLGVTESIGASSPARSPAYAQRDLGLRKGQSVLEIEYGSAKDRFAVEVTDSSTSLHAIHATFAEADERVRRRRPPR